MTVLKTQNIIDGEKNCPVQTLSVCNQIIQLQKNATSNVIDEIDFNVVCGQPLPDHDHDDPRAPDHTGTGGDGDVADNAWSRLSPTEQMTIIGAGAIFATIALYGIFR